MFSTKIIKKLNSVLMMIYDSNYKCQFGENLKVFPYTSILILFVHPKRGLGNGF